MEEFLSGSLFRFLLFPFGSVFLGIAVKYVTRNDRFAKFRKEDMAVGLDLLRTACLTFVVMTTDRALALREANAHLADCIKKTPPDVVRAQEMQSKVEVLSAGLSVSGWVVAAMFVAMWSVSTMVRKWGWKTETEMHTLMGIAVPLAFGTLALIWVMAGGSR